MTMSGDPAAATTIRLADDREYAWLLVRSDALAREFGRLWRFVPIRRTSAIARMIGYPIRLVVFLVTTLLSVALVLLIVLPLLQLPVAAFAYLHGLVPDWVWYAGLGTGLLVVAGTLATAVGAWLPAEATGSAPARGPADGATAQVVASPTDDGRGWNRWRSVHVSHEASRGALFAGLAVVAGILLQCLVVVLGPLEFAGRIATAWQWPLLFSERLLNTLLLGIPAGIVPVFADIRPSSVAGQLLLAAVDVCYASGAIAMGLQVLIPAFRQRELFRGTTRDLADYLENFDISGGNRMMIHRVGVVRPLDENEVISVSKTDFFERVMAAAETPEQGSAGVPSA